AARRGRRAGGPRHRALWSGGRGRPAAGSRSGQGRCWDTQTRRLSWERKIEDGFNLRGLAFTPDSQALICAHVVRRTFPVDKKNIEQGWVIDSRLTRLTMQPDAVPASAQLALDTRGLAVGDPHGVAFRPDGRRLVVTASGTHELLLLDPAALPWNSGDPGDFLDPRLQADERKFQRLDVGGRPLALAFLEETE